MGIHGVIKDSNSPHTYTFLETLSGQIVFDEIPTTELLLLTEEIKSVKQKDGWVVASLKSLKRILVETSTRKVEEEGEIENRESDLEAMATFAIGQVESLAELSQTALISLENMYHRPLANQAMNTFVPKRDYDFDDGKSEQED